ncbi:MAG: hotdog fold thioesterase [Calditrichia bacterium]
MIWKHNLSLDELNEWNKDTLSEHLGIEFVEIGDDYLAATMPVDHRTVQPMRLLHGGASAALAETIGSVAANLCVDATKYACVGLEINANHLKPVRSGKVKGITRPLQIGKRIQVWEIKIYNEHEKLVCVSRLTMAVIEKK